MKKSVLPVLGIVGVACLFGGCYSPSVSYANYKTTAFAEVALKSGGSVKIAAAKDASKVAWLIDGLKSEFAQSGIEVKDDQADYWMIVDSLVGARLDSGVESAYTSHAQVMAYGAPDGVPGAGYEQVTEIAQTSYTMSRGVSVSVYEAASLTPVYYVEIPVYDGAIVPAGTEHDSGIRTINSDISAQIIARVKDIFITQEKPIKTPIPSEASSAMRSAMNSSDVPAAVAEAAAKCISEPFDSFIKDVQEGKCTGSELERKLSDYYIQAIAEEIGNLDTERLEALHARHVAILQYSTSDSLSLACPIALARLEYKIANLNK